MITETDLNEAIAEMYGQRRPNADTCLKLASYLTIKDKLYPENKPEPPQIDRGYSAAASPVAAMIDYDSKTAFGEAVTGRPVAEVLAKLDEIMTGLFVINPRLYNRIMEELTDA